MLYNTLDMLYTTFVKYHVFFSYVTCYIQWYVFIIIYINDILYGYITYSAICYTTCYICCIVLLRQEGDT